MFPDYLPCLLALGRTPNATRGCQRVRTARHGAAQDDMHPRNEKIAHSCTWLKLEKFMHKSEHPCSMIKDLFRDLSVNLETYIFVQRLIINANSLSCPANHVSIFYFFYFFFYFFSLTRAQTPSLVNNCFSHSTDRSQIRIGQVQLALS